MERVVFKPIIKTITALLHCNLCSFHYIKGGFKIQEEKKYYNQQDLIDEIYSQTDCSKKTIWKVLNSLGDVVKDKFSDMDDFVEIKLFPGLKVTSKFIPVEQSDLNLCKDGTITSKTLLSLDAKFSKNFKNEIHNLHRQYE